MPCSVWTKRMWFWSRGTAVRASDMHRMASALRSSRLEVAGLDIGFGHVVLAAERAGVVDLEEAPHERLVYS